MKVLRESGLVQGEIDGPRVCYCVDRRTSARWRLWSGGYVMCKRTAWSLNRRGLDMSVQERTRTVEVFDPAMCCSTVCGPSVDPPGGPRRGFRGTGASRNYSTTA